MSEQSSVYNALSCMHFWYQFITSVRVHQILFKPSVNVDSLFCILKGSLRISNVILTSHEVIIASSMHSHSLRQPKTVSNLYQRSTALPNLSQICPPLGEKNLSDLSLISLLPFYCQNLIYFHLLLVNIGILIYFQQHSFVFSGFN